MRVTYPESSACDQADSDASRAPAGWELLAHMRRVMCTRPGSQYSRRLKAVQQRVSDRTASAAVVPGGVIGTLTVSPGAATAAETPVNPDTVIASVPPHKARDPEAQPPSTPSAWTPTGGRLPQRVRSPTHP